MCLICGMSNCDCEKGKDQSKSGAMAFVAAFTTKNAVSEDHRSKAALISSERLVDPYLNHLAWLSPGLAGRLSTSATAEQQLEGEFAKIGKGGGRYGDSTMRLHTILGCQLRPRQWGPPVGEPCENLLLLGCYPAMFSRNVQALASIVDRLGGRYTLLAKELCCGTLCDTVPLAKKDKPARGRYHSRPERLIDVNVRAAKRLGVKRIYYACLWCVYVTARHDGDKDPDVQFHYYPDLALDLVERVEPRFKLKRRIAYYSGCTNSRCIYLGPTDFDVDWLRYRAILDRVEGLDIVQIPDYCCNTNPDAILDAANADETTTIVTPCGTCRNHLELMRPQSRSTFTSVVELLAEAMLV